MHTSYVFVDAENHFLRSKEVGEQFGEPDLLKRVSNSEDFLVPGIRGFPESIEGRRFGWNPDLQLFWDCHWLSRGGILGDWIGTVKRAVYVCSCAGDEDKVHSSRVAIRSLGFEPVVIREPKNAKNRRDNTREQHQLIDKPKGCDIALATRMVADAAAGLYDTCLLFTSDADFLPAIRVVRRMGKAVVVLGYKTALQQRSEFLFQPDKFVDLERRLQNFLDNHPSVLQGD